jgi:hypothetical protein
LRIDNRSLTSRSSFLLLPIMKNNLRVLAAVAFIALPSMAQAQQTGSINASADIATVFAFGASTPLSFGSVTPGTTATGSGSIAFSRNVGVIWTLPDAAATGQITGPGGTITPTFTCGTGSTATTITTAFSSCAPATGTAAVLTVAAPAALVNEFVIFNGSLSAAQTNTVPGNYSGTIRITATAN